MSPLNSSCLREVSWLTEAVLLVPDDAGTDALSTVYFNLQFFTCCRSCFSSAVIDISNVPMGGDIIVSHAVTDHSDQNLFPFFLFRCFPGCHLLAHFSSISRSWFASFMNPAPESSIDPEAS